MKFSQIKAIGLLSGALLLTGPIMTHANNMPSQAGRILLDVEHKGEAWYVDPVSNQRVFLANGAVAYEVLRDYGLGISNADLEKIPVGFVPVLQNPEDVFNELEPMFTKCDPSARESTITQSLAAFKTAFDEFDGEPMEFVSDEPEISTTPVWTGADALCLSGTIRELVVSDKHITFMRAAMQSLGNTFNDSDKDRIGYSDESQFGTSPWEADSDADGHEDGVEIEGGFSPLGSGKAIVDQALVNRLKGRILLQVEGAGQAWYVHPVTGRRYYLATGTEAYRLMSQLGIGAPSNMISAITPESESALLSQAVNATDAICEGFDCFEDGIARDVNTKSMLTLTPSMTLPDASKSQGELRILAHYISGKKKDYASFELTRIDGGSLKGGDMVDLMAANEILPEGMTTEQKAQLAEDLEVTYTHLLSDFVSVMPRLTCVIPDRQNFLSEWQSARAIIEENLANGVDENSILETENVLFASSAEDTSAANCTWQGGAL